MREVMREGQTEARIELERFAEPGWYAVGALEGLGGEIFVEDGVVTIARDAPDLIGESPQGLSATLLTAAHVTDWRDTTLTVDADLAEIERAIAAELGAPTDAPTAPTSFLVVGSVRSLELHVVRGSCPIGSDAPEHQPARWSAEPGDRARLVGFFAPGRAGELTHHGTSSHVHALVYSGEEVRIGHVDAVQFAAGATLRLPAIPSTEASSTSPRSDGCTP